MSHWFSFWVSAGTLDRRTDQFSYSYEVCDVVTTSADSPPLGLLVDMDGVLVDFVTAALRLHDRLEVLEDWPAGEWDMPEAMGISSPEFWGSISEAGADFWASLEPYPWCDELLELVQSTGPWCILTSPSGDPFCAAGKITWLQKRWGRGFRDFLIGPPKWICARPDQLLIDDNDTNIDNFRDRGGHGILFPQPWNRNHGLVEDRMGYLREQLQQAVSAG